MLDLRLASNVGAAAEARRALETFTGGLTARRRSDVELLVSELVTNAVRHGGLQAEDRIHLRADVDGARMRIEVQDPGRGFEPHAPQPDPSRESGWGLFLVGELADRWGVERATPGTRVWFEIDRDGG
jgi:anti-sigma regulatory factor (Ser/Thr protein kinase)